MHAVDFANCVQRPAYLPHSGCLGQGTASDYAQYLLPFQVIRDSFPGLMALRHRWHTRKTVGAFYDVAWDRVLAPPAATTGNGLAAGPCNKNSN